MRQKEKQLKYYEKNINIRIKVLRTVIIVQMELSKSSDILRIILLWSDNIPAVSNVNICIFLKIFKL